MVNRLIMNRHFVTLTLGALIAISSNAVAQSKFVVFGHIRDMAPNHENILDSLVLRINAENPDYIFLLGDLTYDGKPEHWEMIDRFLEKLDAPLISAPGNHDVTQPPLGGPGDRVLLSYTKRFGYLYLTLKTEDATYITINSCDNAKVVNNYLRLALKKVDTSKHVFLLSHFKLWDDNKANRGNFPEFSDDWYFLWNKKFDWEEILPEIKNKVDHVIAGDCTYSWEPDVVDGIHVHPIGIGSPGSNMPILYFTGQIDSVGNFEMTRNDITLSTHGQIRIQPIQFQLRKV